MHVHVHVRMHVHVHVHMHVHVHVHVHIHVHLHVHIRGLGHLWPSLRSARCLTQDAATGAFKPQEDSYLNGAGGPSDALLRTFSAAVAHLRPAAAAPLPKVLYLQGQRCARAASASASATATCLHAVPAATASASRRRPRRARG